MSGEIPACNNCRFSSRDSYLRMVPRGQHAVDGVLACRHNPPVPLTTQSNWPPTARQATSFSWRFPVIYEGEWCGSYERAPVNDD